MSTSSSSYLLGASKREQDRLHDHLESFGQKRLLSQVRPGMRILDVGCGPGAVSALLARATGAEGWVVGLDLQAKQVERARAHALALGLSQLSFQVGDATALPFDDDAFDLVYAKFLLTHVPNRQSGLEEMARVLAPGGTLFLYDVDAGGAVFWPEGTPTQSAWDLSMTILRDGGSDIELGRKLYTMLCELGLQDVRSIPEMTGACAGQPRLMAAAKRQIAGVLESLSERAIAGGYLTAEGLQQLMESVLEDQPNEFFTLCGMACWGRRPR